MNIYLFRALKTSLENKQEELKAYAVSGDSVREKTVYLKEI